MKGKNQASYNAIKDSSGKVVYELNEVLDVWSGHFDKLSSPKDDKSFNPIIFERVESFVKSSIKLKDNSVFLDEPITTREIEEAISK